jgi:hypothetical protein
MTTIMRASRSNPEDDDHPYITRSKLLPERRKDSMAITGKVGRERVFRSVHKICARMKYPFRSQAYQPRADVYLSNYVYGSTQITRYGVTRDGHRRNQTPDHIGGYARVIR